MTHAPIWPPMARPVPPREPTLRALLWHVVDAALEQPYPTPQLARALNALLTRTGGSQRLR